MENPPIVIVMGVSGVGKTTVGQQLAIALQVEFSDADSFHSAENKEKMRTGIPLTDEDREPWLLSMRAAIKEWQREGKGHVLACSALKQQYRDILSGDDPTVSFVYLKGSFDLISQRLKERKGHFFDQKLLQSQFDTLEEPVNVISIDAKKTPNEIVNEVLSILSENWNLS